MLLIHSSVIPTIRAAAVEAALIQVFNTADVTAISLLAGGLSGSFVYKIIINNQPYVLKLNPPADTTTAFSGNLALAAAARIAPPLHYEDKLQGIVISDFIDSKPVRSIFTPDKLISKLAETIKTVHAIPCQAKGKDLFETVDSLVENFKSAKMLSGPIFNECFQFYELIKNKYPKTGTDQVFSHNDLNPNNILCDGKKIWIIDWDAACLNDRYIDLANAANFFIHTEEQEIAFLNVYFNYSIDDHKIARFYIMRQVCRLVYAMLMFQLAMQNKPGDYLHNQEMEGIDLKTFGALMATGKLSLAAYEGQLMFGKALLNEAVHQMRTPRFAGSLAQFSSAKPSPINIVPGKSRS